MTLKPLKIKKEVDRVIEKGGHVKADLEEPTGHTNFNLRMPKKMTKEIDDALTRTVGISKTGFILQAIHEKLKKEQ